MLTSHTPIAEDNLNISLKEITVTGRDGRVSQLDQVYIRGSMIRFFIVPDMLQNAPMCVPFARVLDPCPLTYDLSSSQVQARRPECDEGTGYRDGKRSRYDHARCVLGYTADRMRCADTFIPSL